MSTMINSKCACCGEAVERLRYFPRQLLTADDMDAEQKFILEKLRLHNRYLHGWGVVCGFEVEPVTNAKGWQVRVCPGYALSPCGDEISIDECITVDLKTGAKEQPCSVRWPCPPVGEMPPARDGSVTAYVAVRYAECFTRPVRVHPAGCGCDETGCEYSRVRESYEIKVLWKLPDSHTKETVKPGRVVPCPPCTDDPWVVLATIKLPKDERTGITDITYGDRRTLSPPSIVENGFIAEDVLFEPDGSILTPKSQQILDRLVAFMNENKDVKVSLHGYAYSGKSKTENPRLSDKRWQSVKDYLVKKGIESSRISGKGFGEANPIADNNTGRSSTEQ